MKKQGNTETTSELAQQQLCQIGVSAPFVRFLDSEPCRISLNQTGVANPLTAEVVRKNSGVEIFPSMLLHCGNEKRLACSF